MKITIDIRDEQFLSELKEIESEYPEKMQHEEKVKLLKDLLKYREGASTYFIRFGLKKIYGSDQDTGLGYYQETLLSKLVKRFEEKVPVSKLCGFLTDEEKRIIRNV